MKIFLGLVEIAGYYSRLQQGFHSVGIEAEFMPLYGNKFNYSKPKSKYLLPNIIEKINYQLEKENGRFQLLLFSIIKWYILRPLLFLWALFTFDVFIFSYGISFFNLYDIPLLRIINKIVIFQFHGSDSRPPYLDGAFLLTFTDIGDHEILMIREKRKQISRINRWASYIIDTPTAGHFHTKPIINWMSIGLPCLQVDNSQIFNKEEKHQLRILHSPSYPVIKGTGIIRNIIAELQVELDPLGYDIEYVEVIDKPNCEVILELQRCDFVIDQVFADYGMPGFATEAAAFGKPVVISGYAAKYWRSEQQNTVTFPSHYVMPNELKQTIRNLIIDQELRERSGINHKRFVETKWAADKVAERYINLIHGKAESEWYFDPNEIDYLHGCGIDEKDLKKALKDIFLKYREVGLQLSDKPDLVKKLKIFVEI